MWNIETTQISGLDITKSAFIYSQDPWYQEWTVNLDIKSIWLVVNIQYEQHQIVSFSRNVQLINICCIIIYSCLPVIVCFLYACECKSRISLCSLIFTFFYYGNTSLIVFCMVPWTWNIKLYNPKWNALDCLIGAVLGVEKRLMTHEWFINSWLMAVSQWCQCYAKQTSDQEIENEK